jgi:hypothetical protein
MTYFQKLVLVYLYKFYLEVIRVFSKIYANLCYNFNHGTRGSPKSTFAIFDNHHVSTFSHLYIINFPSINEITALHFDFLVIV